MDALVRARADDDAVGLRFEDQRWTWREHVQASADRAALLESWRRPGPFHIGVLLENVPEFSFLLGAAAVSGAVIVGLNPTRRGEELARDVRHADCQFVLADERYSDLLEGLDLGVAAGRVIRVDSTEWTDAVAEHAGAPLPGEDVAPDELFMLIFTSGTTGAPKAVKCSQGKIATQGSGVAARFELGAADTTYLSMPLFHSNAIIAGWTPTVACGGTIALARRFSASGFLPDVRRFGATYANYVGKPLSYVLAQPERDDDASNPLRVVFGNEAAPSDIDRFARRFDVPVFDGFGSTEGGLSVQRIEGTPPGSLGKPVGDVRIIDPETDEECPVGEFDEDGRLRNHHEAIGEMVNFDGSGSFEGYYRNPEETERRVRGGRYYSGDLAYRDADGWFYHAGRSPDWLRVDGENFAAAPVERILEQHPEVVLAAVYAVPDVSAGDQVMAALVLRDSAVLDPEEFVTWLASHRDLSPKWWPRFLRIAEELPQTPTNKVIKRALVAERWECDDPVFWREEPDTYRLLTPEDVASLRDRFADNGREHLLVG